MIFEAILNLLTSLITLLLSALPELTIPTWYTDDFLPFWTSTISGVSGFRAWFPFDAIGTAVAVLSSTFAITVAIRIVRMVISLFTGGGGSAA